MQNRFSIVRSIIVMAVLSGQFVYGQRKPIVMQQQERFAVGGSVVTNPGAFDPIKRTPEGQTFHGDPAYVFYHIPKKVKKLPLVLCHGIGQFSKTWDTTPDGREGFRNIFLGRVFGVYLLDQPRRGNASPGRTEATISPAPDEYVSQALNKLNEFYHKNLDAKSNPN